MICEYCQSEWFPAKFHPGTCGECGAPRLRSAPQETCKHDGAIRMCDPPECAKCGARLRPRNMTQPMSELIALSSGSVPRATVLTLCGEPVEVDYSQPGGVIHLPPGGTAQLMCPEVEGKTLHQALTETFPYQTWNAMSNALMMWRLG